MLLLLSRFLPLFWKHCIIQYSLLSVYVILLLKILSDCLWVLNMCNRNLLQLYSYLMRIPYNRYIMTEYFQFFSPFVYMTAIYFTYLQTISSVQFSSVAQSFLTLQSQVLKHARLPCPSPTTGTYSNSCPLSLWCHPIISSSVTPSPPASNLSQHQGLFNWVSFLNQVAKVLEFQLQHQPFQWIFRTDLI